MIRKEKTVSQNAMAVFHKERSVTMDTINKLCGYFHCQPGDLLEYMPDEVSEEQE